METINKRFRIVRENLGLSVRKFAAALGVSNGAISMIENEQRQPAKRLCRAVCAIYNVNEKWLETGEGEMYKADKDVILADYVAKIYQDNTINKEAKDNLVELLEIVIEMDNKNVDTVLTLAKRLLETENR